MGKGYSQRSACRRRICSCRTAGQRRNELLCLGFRGKSGSACQSDGVETGAVLNNSAARITERSTTKAVEAEFSYLNQQLLSQSGFAIDIGTIETAPDFAIPCYDSVDRKSTRLNSSH